ncbi:Serine/threonine-protein kinase haspin homolog, partial [Geodia barretti]
SGTRDGAPRSTPVQHPGQKDETKVIHLQTRQPGVFPALSRSQGYCGGLHSLQSEARCICLPVECTLSSPVKPDQLSLFIIIGFISFGISVSVDCSISVLAPLGDYKTADECVSYHDLEQLPWLFEGRGDLQFDVYRDMRKITGCVSRGQWEKYHPSTNVMWLAFLATKLSDRALQLRSTARRSWRAALRPIARRISTYPSAHDAFVHLFSSDN